MLFKQKTIFVFGILVMFFVLSGLGFPCPTLADSENQLTDFFVESSYDAEKRTEVQATLQKVSKHGYFYVETDWYNNLSEIQEEAINQNLEILSQEFDQTIYPELTTLFGQEWKPGIDNDEHIYVLFHEMKQGTAGYFRTEDEAPRLQSPHSNEREMVFLNVNYLVSPLLKSFLAHEFTHLITFNQKDRLRGVEEEVWLNEARADYAPTFLGYDQEYQGSHLQKRLKTFLQSPSNSLTEWKGQPADYGIINVFIHYLVDHYGIEVLVESLKSSEVGIPSLNTQLSKLNFDSFSQVFFNWSIATFLNDCTVGAKYCYKNENLANIKITPSLILLPATEKTEFSLDYSTTYWSGNWYRIIGGGDNLEVTFQGDEKVEFEVPYILCEDALTCSVGSLELSKSQKGELSFEDFEKQYTSLTLIPFVENETSGFNGEEEAFAFSIQAKSSPENEEEKLIEELKARIAELQAQIAEVKAKITAILKQRVSCASISQNLALGLNHPQVRCLQEFLNLNPATRVATAGPGSPGQETNYFGALTQAAAARFQEKYASEILTPLGLKRPTGFLGSLTRLKINQLLSP